VTAGNIEAQHTLIRVLKNETIKALPDYYSLLQSMTFLQKEVTPQVLSFYSLTMQTAKTQNVRFASMYTLGALIQNLKNHHHQTLMINYNQQLIAQLTPKKSPQEQYALMFALRNTDIEKNLNYIKPYINSSSEVVRRGTVRAAGKFKTKQSTHFLLDSLDDKSDNVKNGVIQSLIEHKLVNSELQIVYEKVIDGNLGQTVDVTLLNLMIKYAQKYPLIIHKTLTAMLKRGVGNRETETRIHTLLKSMNYLSKKKLNKK
jgi:hypothetical protein